ncbi:ATP-binding protein [Sphingomonas sp. R647]|uniref:ATP-binding protein n=1 Tax=Sphingomonas sp. R647 TaxID=2875233 RepID=UPI001CD67649|nr:ATP-binding protein [Sphingomonas sp. R647]MCA1197297.1 ATP-binding protein [Sphingomonas sp. R647]
MDQAAPSKPRSHLSGKREIQTEQQTFEVAVNLCNQLCLRVARQALIKKAAIVRAGFDYQDLAGLEVLIRHFRDPNLYAWVELEAEDPQVQSLDDVIAFRQDGRIDYVQVKFTADAERYPLDWEWLLASKKRGTSMLAKWASAFLRAQLRAPIASAGLRTNRRPSPEFAECLNSHNVDLDRLESDLRARVEDECGGKENARAFFDAFDFVSALPDLAKFEHSLRDQLIPSDTDEAGWLRLRDEVRRWATFRGSPAPDGKILRDHLIQLITRKRPLPIRQDFSVPEHYAPPSVAFDQRLRRRTETPSTPLTIIWGSPGRGKSTYLSYLTAELHAAKSVVLRHHYFLPNDQAGNRTSFFEIANSLLHQLGSQRRDLLNDNEDASALRETLERAAETLKAEGAKLYLIIDGLDHVWRDTERVDQLNHLFNIILPLPDNVAMLVGTQKVPDAQLPKSLLERANVADWLEIPSMDEAAVHRWVRHQDSDRPLRLAYEAGDRVAEIDAIAGALFKISAGHPLHLIYSLENLRLTGQPLRADLVEALPPCPDGDIRNYYRWLWLSLSESARDLLHGLSGSDFYWPSEGVRSCFGNYYEIAFLLEPRASGLSPFHASLFAWVRESSDHDEAYRALLPRIVAWLDQEAPAYWRWGWLWLARAELGDATDLLAGCTRDWAVASLAEGWSETQIEKIIAAAERAAFNSYDFAHTVTLRAIRHRVTSARRFQARAFGLFRAIGLAAHGNSQQIENLIDAPVELEDDEWTQLVLYSLPEKRGAIVEAAVTELWRRIDAWIVLRHKPGQDFDQLSASLIRCSARAGAEGLPQVLRFLARYRDPHPHYARLVQALGAAGEIDGLKELRRTLRGKAHGETRRRAQEEMLRAAWRQGGDPRQLLGRMQVLSPLLAARAVFCDPAAKPRLDRPPAPSDIVKRRYRSEKSPTLEHFFSDYFWTRIVQLKTDNAGNGYEDLDRTALGWAATALATLDQVAQEIVGSKVPLSFSTPFVAMAELAPVTFNNDTEQDYFQYIAFRKAINQIAIDLNHIGSEDSREWRIPFDEFEIARGSAHWVDEVWLSDNAHDGVPYLSANAAARLLTDLAEKFASQVSDFAERGENWTQLAALAWLYGIPDSKQWISRAADCLLGYGNHKDLSALQMLEAIDFVHSADPLQSERWIRAVAPIIEKITYFTDGDETDHVRSCLIDTVGITMPVRLGALHAHHLHRNEWRYADECVEAAFGAIDFETPEARALSRSLIDRKLLIQLEARGAASLAAKTLHAEQLLYLGGEPLEGLDRHSSDSDWADREPNRAVNPTRFAPARFEAFVEEITKADVGYRRRPDLLRQWLDHWASQGRALQALRAFQTYLEVNDNVWSIEELLDHAFQISLAAEGKDRAYSWLVRAHIQRHGWSRFLSGRKDVENRLEMAARYYPERWRDYIRDTSEQTLYRQRSGLWFSIGSEYLVRFLVQAGQVEEAVRVTDALVQTFVAETRDQPIGEVAWLP